MEDNLEYKRLGENTDTMFKVLKISIGSGMLVAHVYNPSSLKPD
jgi:hypothetical protein